MDATRPLAAPPPISVAPRRHRSELTALLSVGAYLVLLAAMRSAAMERLDAPAELATYEMAVDELPAAGRLLVQTLEGASADVADLLDEESDTGAGAWPTPDELAAAAVPPFDPAFLPAGLRHLEAEAGLGSPAWRDLVVRLGSAGTTRSSEVAPSSEGDGIRGAFVLRLIRRDVPPDPLQHPHPHEARQGEQGRLGTQIWYHSDPTADAARIDLRPEGWRWVVPGAVAARARASEAAADA